jgi:hypothetical protein
VEIQAFLDSIPYVGEDLNRSPSQVLQDRQAHCLDGGVFAAAALCRIGYPPLIVDLLPEPGTDDDHVLAVFKQHGLYGAVAKSNFVGLRYRDPVYRNLRELVMSYFEQFFNLQAKKTLRAYTRPLNLMQFNQYNWLWSEAGMEKISQRLYRLKPIPVLSPDSVTRLATVDERSYNAGLSGANYAGLFKPD